MDMGCEKMKISLCMIVKDEEEVLGRCLECASRVADEIVIVDTGSTDNTRGIAKAFTEKIYETAWEDDFAKARNLSFSKATGDYLLWLDADDVIPEESLALLPALRALLERGADIVMCPYETGNVRYYRERFLKRTAEHKWMGHVHECIPPKGKIERFDFTVLHRPTAKDRGMRNLRIYQKWAEKEPLSGRDLFYYGRELYYHKLYTEAIAILEKMLGGNGWYVNKIEACKILSACYTEQNMQKEALSSLFRSFEFGAPRASVLCAIGEIFKEKKDYACAVFWFESALRAADHASEGDFETPDCRTIIPTLELVYLYHVLNEPAKSYEYHKKSEALAPDHPSVIYNKKFFGT